MKLTQIAAKPKLIKIELSDEDIIKEYGEPLEFWIYDRQSMAKFVKLANVSEENYGSLVETVESMILDEDGKEIDFNSFKDEEKMKFLEWVIDESQEFSDFVTAYQIGAKKKSS